MKIGFLSLTLSALLANSLAFTVAKTRSFDLYLAAIKVPEIPFADGDRTIFDGPDGPIIVAKVNGELYSTSAICPHLGLPMKKGKINPNGPGGAPEITCNFHNSCFNMKTGKCNKWVTGALGVENKFISGIMSKAGSGQKDIQAFSVKTEKDGSVFLE